MKDEIKFKEYMTGLGEIHGKAITDTLKNIYWKVLSPFSDNQCEMAFTKLISTCKFFPKPAEFIEILRGDDKDKALTAWQEVMKVLEQGSSIKNGEVTSQCVHILGGWDHLSVKTYDELQWIEKRFIEHYRGLDKHRELDLLEYREGEVKQLRQAKGE